MQTTTQVFRLDLSWLCVAGGVTFVAIAVVALVIVVLSSRREDRN
jgi:hypothetical protein